ncbi:MAG: PAS domain S-box protein [Anaerolineales bacterium]|nr:PAS domain S-box protein [Anaerolineales bacterium]
MPFSGIWFWPLVYYALSAVVALFAAFRILSSEKKYPGAEALASVLIAGSAWVLSIAAGLISPTLQGKLFWLQARYFSIATLSISLYITLNLYLHGSHWLTWQKYVYLSILPLFMPVLLLTNSQHNLIHTQISLAPYGPYQTLVTSNGVGMWVFLAYNIGLVLVGSINTVSTLLQTRRTSRQRGILILAGIIVPITIVLVQFSQANPFGYFSPIPIAIIVSAIISSYLLENARRIQLVSVSRSKIFETIEDIVIVLDDQKSRIIDMNASAEDFTGSSISNLIGRPITRVWPTGLPGELNYKTDSTPKDRIVVDRQGNFHTYEFKYIELLNWQNNPVNYLLVIRDISAHAELEAQISKALQEKETLLREIHHRAKNNLQVISSIFNLQSAMINDPKLKGAFNECKNRMGAIALVHEQLYQTTGLQKINFAEYIETLFGRLRHEFLDYQSNVNIETKMADIQLSIELATPCGLIAYELASNAFKHAFSEGKTGKISVNLQQHQEKQCLLTIRDNGVGIPQHIDHHEGGNLGLSLVRALVSQINGSFIIKRARFRNKLTD